jgi:hypothetical protein
MHESGSEATSSYDGAMDEANMDDLLAGGAMKPPRKKHVEPVQPPQPPGSVSDQVMDKIWREEREDR